MVRDLDSKNGIFMHGLRVREAEVLPGDCLTLGRTEITLCYNRVNFGDDARRRADSPVASTRRPTAGRPTTEELLY